MIGAVSHPAAFSYVIGNFLFPRASRDKVNIESMASMAISIAIIVLVSASIAPAYLVFFHSTALWFYPLSVLLGLACLIFEFNINSFYIFLTKGYIPKCLHINPLWTGCNSSLNLILMVFIVVGEELVFRQMMFSLFMGAFKFSLAQTLLVTSLIYAANHIFMGFNSMSTKFFTGLIYGCLYYISGLSIIIPIITHYVQNILLLRYPKITEDLVLVIYNKIGINYDK